MWCLKKIEFRLKSDEDNLNLNIVIILKEMLNLLFEKTKIPVYSNNQ